MSARELFDRLRYQVYRPAVTTMSVCANEGCEEWARGGGECWACLGAKIEALGIPRAARIAGNALTAAREMHRLEQACEEAEAKPSQEVGRG